MATRRVKIDPTTGERMIDPATGERVYEDAPEAPQKSERETRLDRHVEMSEAMFPRATKAMNENRGYLSRLVGGGLDLLSLPGRALASGEATQKLVPGGDPWAATMGGQFGIKADLPHYEQKGDETFNQSMTDTQGQNLAGKIVRDPALIPSIVTGAGALGLAGKAGLTGLKAATAAGAAEGLVSAGIHQTDKVNSGGEFSPTEAVLETGLSAAMPGVAKVIGKGAKMANSFLGKLAEGLSGASEEALRTYGWGAGKGAKKLAEASGKQGEIGRQLVSALDNLDDFLPEKDIVNQALPNLPPVSTASTIKALETAKTTGTLRSSRNVNTKIDELIEDLKSAADENGVIPASRLRDIRIEIDGEIGDAFGKESNKYVSALKQARHQIADDLVTAAEASGNPEYVTAMKGMADKLQKADRLSQFLGKSAQTREARSEAFISTLYGKNKGERQRAVKEMGEIFGQDFLEASRLASLAADLGDDGKAGWLPRQFTGRAALGPGLAALGGNFVSPLSAAVPLSLSSPKISALMLEGSGIAGQVLNRPGVQAGESAVSRALARPAFRNNQNRQDRP